MTTDNKINLKLKKIHYLLAIKIFSNKNKI